MYSIRREKLREYLRENGTVTIRELCAAFPDVSTMTIHRDLDALEEEGCVVKMRGGARFLADTRAEPAFPVRAVENPGAKERIGKTAARFIQADTTVFVDAGTTGLALAKALPDLACHVFTSAPNVAMECALKNEPFVNLCGGLLDHRNLALSGSATFEYFEKINIDIAFIAASGYTPRAGFTCGKECEAQLKRQVIQKAARVVLMMDQSKFGKMLPFTFADLGDIDCLVTDEPFDPVLMRRFARNRVELYAGDNGHPYEADLSGPQE